MRSTWVELHVPDFGKARAFYGRFGFRIAREEHDYLVMARGGAFLAFWGSDGKARRHAYFRRWPENTKRGYGVEIVVPVEDLEALHTVAEREGAIVSPLRKRSWGARDFRIEDPFGFYVRFTEPYDVMRRADR